MARDPRCVFTMRIAISRPSPGAVPHALGREERFKHTAANLFRNPVAIVDDVHGHMGLIARCLNPYLPALLHLNTLLLDLVAKQGQRIVDAFANVGALLLPNPTWDNVDEIAASEERCGQVQA